MSAAGNVKNKTWAETEPVLLRYFSTLRKRLQLDGADELPPDDEVEPEAEPEDLDVEVVAPDGAFDSSDDEDPADELVSLKTAIPAQASRSQSFRTGLTWISSSTRVSEQKSLSGGPSSSTGEVLGGLMVRSHAPTQMAA